MKNGKMTKDIIGLENEKLGDPLLIKMISNGKLVYDFPTLDEIKQRIKDQLKLLPNKYLEINKEYPYKVDISNKLMKLFLEIKKQKTK